MDADVVFLSVEDVVTIHEEMLTRFGGSRVRGHRGELEGVTAAVLAVENSYYDDVFELAAAYAVYIVMGHVFGDGNKRTGVGSSLVFLHANGIGIELPHEGVVDRMIELQRRAEANPRPPASDLIEWLAAWLRKASRKRRRARGK